MLDSILLVQSLNTHTFDLIQINCIAIYERTNEDVSVPKQLSKGLYTLELNGKELVVKKEKEVKNDRLQFFINLF